MSRDDLPRWVLAAGLGIVLCVLVSFSLDERPIRADSLQTMRMAYNLVHHGVMSVEKEPPHFPSMYREPIPVLFDAMWIRAIEMFTGPAPYEAYPRGWRAHVLKLQDVLWVGLLYVAAFLAAGLFFPTFTLRLIATALVCIPSAIPGTEQAWIVNRLYSDTAASALMLLGSWLFVRVARERQVKLAVLAGVAFAAVALVKAAHLYIFAGILLLLALYLFVLEKRTVSARNAALVCTAFAAGFAVGVLPWMLRNYSALGQFQLTERGGEVLLARANKNMMTLDEYIGTLYVWGPSRGIAGAILGYEPRDLQRGGRLQRLNREESDFSDDDHAAEREGRPEAAISFFRKSRARYVQLIKHYTAQGHPNPVNAANRQMQREALKLIVEHPFRHLALVLPVTIRGALVTFPVLAAAFIVGLRKRRYDLALFVVPALGWALFHMLLTHFISRYGLPLVPVATIAGMALVLMLIEPVRARAGSLIRARFGA